MSNFSHQQAFELAMEHHRAGRLAEAESLYRQLLAVYPGHADLTHALGVLAHHAGHRPAALELIQQAIAANPGAAFYYNNLGLLLADLNRGEEALAAYRTAIRLQPDCAEAYYNMANTLLNAGRTEEAITAFRKTLEFQPNHASALLNLGNALNEAGRTDEAIAGYRAALASDPRRAAIANNLGNLLKDQARLAEAIASYRAALALTPDDPVTLSNLGVALKDHGEIGEALDALRRSVALDPQRAELHSNLIFTSYFDPATTPEAMAEEHRRWDERHAAPHRAHWQAHANDRSPGRRLRVGYVSADFRDHVVGRTLLPCFAAHDRESFECICYSSAAPADDVTAQYRALAAEWRETARLDDAALAERIRADRIDLLVDLSLHTGHNRLLAFARRPAPIQVAWLGYPGTTGIAAMDYRLTDPYLDPPGQDFAGGFEEPMRLPDCWCCYPAPDDSPEPGALPAATRGSVTFGSFNNFAKINPHVLEVWAEIMRGVEGSRLLMISKASRTDHARSILEQHGIAAERVEFLDYYPPAAMRAGSVRPGAYLHRYWQIDIALDPFPYNGMTTTGDALWMGVPVVALIGQMTLGRASYSLLSNVGLPELAAPSEREYVRIATDLAHDLPRLAALRATLRERMNRSPLLDASRFARQVEAAYRTMWERWCAGDQNPLPGESPAPTVRVP